MGRGRPDAQTGGMQRIYIVEDSPILRERVERLVNALPDTLIVGHAASASSAIAGIRECKPDVVLLDLCLEHSSGFDVLREVAAREPGIDVYMMSNFSSEPYRRHAERLGARGFFDKTTEFERLREAIVQRAVVLQH
jgi:two-component system, NarL family, response regulator DevR